MSLKGAKFSRARLSWSLLNSGSGWWNKRYLNVSLIILAGLSALIIMLRRENSEGISGRDIMEELKQVIPSTSSEELHWNYSSYSFHPKVFDWDGQRARWTEEHRNPRPREDARPKVLMVTGSSSEPCKPSVSSQLLIKAAKNKIDYCRMHNIQLFYNLGNPDPEFAGWWVKLPVVRMLMLQHPEIEWIWWVDADAIFTDLTFEPPFAKLKKYNLVLYGNHHLVYGEKDWKGINTGDFFIRNCQWSLDLIDKWSSMGKVDIIVESGKFLSTTLFDRPADFAADDQSGLVSILVHDKANLKKWIPKVKLVTEMDYSLSGNWALIGPNLEEMMEKHHPGLGDYRWPLVTHFAGCQPCDPENSNESWDECLAQMARVLDFSDIQVYQLYGYKLHMGNSSQPLTRIIDSTNEKAGKVFSFKPEVLDWDEKRQVWMKKHAQLKKHEVMIVSGSSPKPCARPLGDHLLLRAMKNKIDYGRLHDIEIFYNMAVVHSDLTGWWSKIPLIRILMLNHPEVEWFWWMDGDAVLTDMSHNIPFARYNAHGYNLVLYGDDHEVYEKKSFSGVNAGIYLVRNCQWSLDLFDRWASFGATKALQKENEKLLHKELSRPFGWPADDQSVLVYLLITEQDKWAPKIHFEKSFLMSGDWTYLTPMFDAMTAEERPFVTHFAGCKPCEVWPHEKCLVEIDRALNFADNQVLESFGLHHPSLISPIIEKISKVGKAHQKDMEEFHLGGQVIHDISPSYGDDLGLEVEIGGVQQRQGGEGKY